MKLSGYTILDIYGIERVPLDGEYTADALAETMIENWVPYIECHRKCCRADYCKYAPVKKGQDIRCGIVVESIRNLTRATYSILERLEGLQIQKYLDGAFFLSRFILEAEGAVGMCMDDGCVRYWDELSPMLFGRLTRLRGHLNDLAANWKEIPELRATQHMLLVEGESEQAFLDELRKSHSSWFLDLNVDVYGGKGNRRPGRIQMLLDRYARQGFVVYAVGDADGASADIFQRLVDDGLVKRENTFTFSHDFESAVPLGLLHHVLTELELIGDIPVARFRNLVSPTSGSILQQLRDACSLDVGPHKVAVARGVARVLNHPDLIWWRNDGFMERSELGQFLRFIQQIK